MANFRRENSSRGNRSDSRPKSFGDRGRRPSGNRERSFGSRDRGSSGRSSEMFTVTCDKCGKECQVPFKPTGNKPVLCSECFRGKSDSAPRTNSSGITQEQFEILNKKLDMIIEALSSEEFDEDEEDEE